MKHIAAYTSLLIGVILFPLVVVYELALVGWDWAEIVVLDWLNK